MAGKSGYEVLAQKVDGRLHAAMIRNGDIYDFYVDSGPEHPRWASIYLGKVTRIDTKLDGAFIALSSTREGFLAGKHALRDGKLDRDATISDKLKPGQMVLVQIKSEGKAKTPYENHKLPRLSMKLYIPGRQMHMNPYGRGGVQIAEHLRNDQVNAFAAKLEKYGSWIVHSGQNALDLESMKHEAKQLILIWRGVKEAIENAPKNPRMLFMGPNAVQRMIIDYAAVQFDHFELAEDANPNSMSGWLEAHAPYLKEKMIISPAHKVDIFEMRDVYGALEDAHSPVLDLPNGGSLVIDSTHAMTIIDVNRGSGGDIVSVNKEAARLAARHFRLRNLSGAILIDFINLPSKTERYDLIRLLKKCIGTDPGNTAVHGFTRLGIMEVTRKRRTATLHEKTSN